MERFPDAEATSLRLRYVEALHRWYPRLQLEEIDFETFRRERLRDALEPWGELDEPGFAAYTAEKERIPSLIRPAPGAIETLRALRRLGVRVGILTNGPAVFQRRKLEVTGLLAEVDAIGISGELGVAKPDPRAYGRTLELLGTAAAESAMVGDSLANDVVGALDAGLAAAVWINARRGGTPPDGALTAASIPAAAEILGLLRNRRSEAASP